MAGKNSVTSDVVGARDRCNTRLHQVTALANVLRTAGTAAEGVESEDVVVVADLISTLSRSAKKDMDAVLKSDNSGAATGE